MPLFSQSVRYFEKVADLESVRQAAGIMNINPSAVSRQILILERELGLPLFERLPRGLRLTAAGRVLLTQVRRWGDDRSQLTDALKSLVGAKAGVVRIAASEALTYRVLPAAISAFRAQLPGFRVEASVGTVDEIVGQIAMGGADLGIGFNVPPTPTLRTEFTLGLKVGAVVCPDHPLARRKRISLEECRPYPLILPDDALGLRSSIRTFLRAAADTHTIAAVANRIVAIKSLAQSGVGIAFLNRLDVAAEVAAKTLRFVPLANAVPSKLSIVVPRRSSDGTPLALFFNCLKQELESAIASWSV